VLSYLSPKDGPVLKGLEKHEVVYAKDQPQYTPLRTIKAKDEYKSVLSRWTLTAEQRQIIAAGGDIFLECGTFGQPLQPLRLQVGIPNSADVAMVAREYLLPLDES